MAFSVPPLPYAYDALEPHIDQQTMELHHDKHHQAYVDKANAALEGVMTARFHAIPRVQATELLLQERTPFYVPVTRPRPLEVTHMTPLMVAIAPRRYRSPHTPQPHAAFLSNGRYTAMVTNAGGGWSQSAGAYQVYVGDSSALANLPLQGGFLVTATPGARQVSVSAPSTVTAGKPFTVKATLTAAGTQTLYGVRLSLQLPQGWTARPSSGMTLKVALTTTTQLRRPCLSVGTNSSAKWGVVLAVICMALPVSRPAGCRRACAKCRAACPAGARPARRSRRGAPS